MKWNQISRRNSQKDFSGWKAGSNRELHVRAVCACGPQRLWNFTGGNLPCQWAWTLSREQLLLDGPGSEEKVGKGAQSRSRRRRRRPGLLIMSGIRGAPAAAAEKISYRTASGYICVFVCLCKCGIMWP